jgi:hypothetical protein
MVAKNLKLRRVLNVKKTDGSMALAIEGEVSAAHKVRAAITKLEAAKLHHTAATLKQILNKESR